MIRLPTAILRPNVFYISYLKILCKFVLYVAGWRKSPVSTSEVWDGFASNFNSLLANRTYWYDKIFSFWRTSNCKCVWNCRCLWWEFLVPQFSNKDSSFFVRIKPPDLIKIVGTNINRQGYLGYSQAKKPEQNLHKITKTAWKYLDLQNHFDAKHRMVNRNTFSSYLAIFLKFLLDIIDLLGWIY